MSVHIEHVVTSGTFSLDGQTWEVENNMWLIGDEEEVLVVDAAHDAAAIAAAARGRKVTAIACTHAHDDHVRVAPELRSLTGAPVLLHPADDELWRMTHAAMNPDGGLADGGLLRVADSDVQVIHTPGHSPGGVCLYVGALGAVFSGDTLFRGGPGATGRSFSSYDTILDSITTRLFTLPPETVVHPGHGDNTTIADEQRAARGWRRPEAPTEA